MSKDLSKVLKDAAPSPRSRVTVDGLAARGRRRRRGRLVLASAGCVVVVVAVGALALTAGDDADSRLRVGSSPPAQAPGEDTPAQDPSEGTPIAPPLVEPDSGLVAGQAVTVTTDDFTEGNQVWVTPCGTDELENGQAGSACDLSQVVMAEPTPQGATATIHVDRAIHIGSEWVDCTAEPGRCAVAVGSLDDRTGAWTEITFAPDAVPTDSPTIEVLDVPASGGGVVTIEDGTTVEVAGSGFPVDAAIGIGLCAPKADCGPFLIPTTVTTGGDGTFTVEIPIKASIDVNGLHYECATGCRIVAARITPPPPDAEPFRAERLPVVVTGT